MPNRPWALARTAGLQALLALATLAALDLAAYALLPENLARYYVGYRKPGSPGDRTVELRNYYHAHPERGHDIALDQSTWHSAQDLRYPVWSNRFGCFDHDWPAVPANYVYFAGDSFTWGFSPFDDKFTTVFEQESGRASLKCGVIGTGQRHQFSKFLEVTKQIGHPPEQVIIGYCANDIVDDFLYPHLTVVSGWLVHDVYVDAHDRTWRVDEAFLSREAEQRVATAEADEQGAVIGPLRDALKRYSLVSNLIYTALANRGMGRRNASSDVVYEGRPLARGYTLMRRYERAGEIDYSHPLADANKEALTLWRDHAHENGYRLSVLLIPPRHAHDSERFYRQIKLFLTQLGIDFLDLAEEFRRLRTHVNEAYWVQDAHFTPEGNRIAGQAIVDRWVR
ncbi:MAG: hypothetical protein L0271_02470 [Gemmatimonadetes bacterium]|nr:hypothetical protein [Gemmatimonadota bacterium]